MDFDTSTAGTAGHREFYLPASTVPTAAPGRLERFLTRRLSDHSGLDRPRA